MSNSFLPNDYEPPQETGGKYIQPSKIDGKVKVRILSKPLPGYEAWKDKTPVRGKTVQEVTDKGYDPVDSYGKPQTIKHFWAMKVYDFDAGEVKILHITQKSIRNRIIELSESEDWGDPRQYDIQINKQGEKLESVYSVTPLPPKPLHDDVQGIIKATPVCLSKLYDGDNPFECESEPTDDDMPL